ncbi:IS110 family transposase [Streptomyces sp. NPDC056682]|uniref:IS110 family transposase n=1 Tax=Streptomyces sp. NPDC056682 TaxID=3345909 RepID=UPI0036B070F7
MTTGLSPGREALRNVDVAISAVAGPVECDRSVRVIDISNIDLFLGLDVGKGEHHATAITPASKKAFDKRLPNSEPRLREVFGRLQAKHGTVLVVVDQPATIGALPLAVARDMGCEVAYLPGLTMRRIADLYPGEAKTDARDAFIIADAARAMPHTLRSLELDDETVAELEMIVGFDDDLAAEATRLSNRLRGLFTQVHPHLERVLGPRMQHPAVLKLLSQYGSPAQIRKAGRRRLVALIRPKAPRMAERLVDEVFTALDEQTVVVPGTDAASLIVPSLADSLQAVLDQRKLIAARIEELLEAHPLSQVLMSMPGIGIRTGARILIDVGDGTNFPSAAHLAAYAGLAPTTRSSGTSIRGEQQSRRGNKQLKRAFFLSAFAALADPASRIYYDKKIKEGKHHTQALLCLARRRADVLFAMLRDGTFYQPPTPITP